MFKVMGSPDLSMLKEKHEKRAQRANQTRGGGRDLVGG